MFPKYVLLSICAFIRVHFGRPGKFHSIHPSGVDTFSKKIGYDQWIFSKKSWKSSLFKSMLVFQLDNLFVFFFSLFFYHYHLFISFSWLFFSLFSFHEVFCYLNMCIFLWGIFAIYMHIQGILLPKHTYIYIFCEVSFCYIHAYLRYLAT